MTKEEILNKLESIKSTENGDYKAIGGQIIQDYREDGDYYVTVKVEEYYFTICGDYDSWDGVTLEYSDWEDTTEKHIDIASKIREYLEKDCWNIENINNADLIEEPYLKDLKVVINHRSHEWVVTKEPVYKIVQWKERLFCIESEDSSWGDNGVEVYEVKEYNKRSKRTGDTTYLEI